VIWDEAGERPATKADNDDGLDIPPALRRGKPAPIDAAQVRELKAQGKGASEIAKALKVYRVLEGQVAQLAGAQIA
jgi:DNA invertase Pin-like site-specific DNA recombinase